MLATVSEWNETVGWGCGRQTVLERFLRSRGSPVFELKNLIQGGLWHEWIEYGRKGRVGCLFSRYREQLLSLAKRNLNPVLARRISPEDIVQDTLSSACAKIDFFENCPDIPVYFKLRTILFQTISAAERKHLQAAKRDAYRDIEVSEDDNTRTQAQICWNQFADTMTGPVTKIARMDRYALLKKAIDKLPENDRNILEMRHFDGLGNLECANLLKIEPKAASIRYVRALQCLREKLTEYTEFHP